ncbi:MAG: hypothetical protein WKG07_01530 [Hymenobacter sp.]
MTPAARPPDAARPGASQPTPPSQARSAGAAAPTPTSPTTLPPRC